MEQTRQDLISLRTEEEIFLELYQVNRDLSGPDWWKAMCRLHLELSDVVQNEDRKAEYRRLAAKWASHAE